MRLETYLTVFRPPGVKILERVVFEGVLSFSKGLEVGAEDGDTCFEDVDSGAVMPSDDSDVASASLYIDDLVRLLSSDSEYNLHLRH